MSFKWKDFRNFRQSQQIANVFSKLKNEIHQLWFFVAKISRQKHCSVSFCGLRNLSPRTIQQISMHQPVLRLSNCDFYLYLHWIIPMPSHFARLQYTEQNRKINQCVEIIIIQPIKVLERSSQTKTVNIAFQYNCHCDIYHRECLFYACKSITVTVQLNKSKKDARYLKKCAKIP